jgi:thioredoxin-related protein
MNKFVHTSKMLKQLGTKYIALLIVLVLFLSGCVSIKDYNAKVKELEEIELAIKSTKKEIKLLERNNRILLDTIAKRIARAKIVENRIIKTLAANNIRIKMNPAALKGITYREQSKDEWAQQWIKENKNNDTNSARNVVWLSKKERLIYYYLNCARLDPIGFCNKYILDKLKYDSTNIYLITLVNYMYSMKPVNAIVPNKVQFDNAKCHAVSAGLIGRVSHDRVNKTCKQSFYGECISFGVSDPLEIVIQLLVDEDVPSLGHRYICLGFYTQAGFSMAPHKAWGTNTVLDFI